MVMQFVIEIYENKSGFITAYWGDRPKQPCTVWLNRVLADKNS